MSITVVKSGDSKMISTGLSILAAIVIVTILWGSATWIRKVLNRSEAEQAFINFVAVILAIVSLIVCMMFGKEIYQFIFGWIGA